MFFDTHFCIAGEGDGLTRADLRCARGDEECCYCLAHWLRTAFAHYRGEHPQGGWGVYFCRQWQGKITVNITKNYMQRVVKMHLGHYI